MSIKRADWVIDLGPEAGDGGGRVVAQGTPEEVAARRGLAYRALSPAPAPRAGRGHGAGGMTSPARRRSSVVTCSLRNRNHMQT